jgi:DNA-binding HxlR family transcriptional regulator
MKKSNGTSLQEEKLDKGLVIEEETRITKIRRFIFPPLEKDSSYIDKSLLQGKSLQVYWYLFEHGPAGVREIQRALNYSSPGLITYQIKKLTEGGLIIKDESTEKYDINIKVKAGLLNFYTKIGPLLIPRFSLYLVGLFVGFFCYLLCSLVWGDHFITNPGSLLFLLLLVLASIVFIYESRMMGKLKPF